MDDSKKTTLVGWLLVLVTICVVAFAVVNITMIMVVADMEKYSAESACVMEYVRVGIERADIATGNGTCWLK